MALAGCAVEAYVRLGAPVAAAPGGEGTAAVAVASVRGVTAGRDVGVAAGQERGVKDATGGGVAEWPGRAGAGKSVRRIGADGARVAVAVGRPSARGTSAVGDGTAGVGQVTDGVAVAWSASRQPPGVPALPWT